MPKNNDFFHELKQKLKTTRNSFGLSALNRLCFIFCVARLVDKSFVKRNAFVSGIVSRWFQTATFFRKKLCCLQVQQHKDGHSPVTCIVVTFIVSSQPEMWKRTLEVAKFHGSGKKVRFHFSHSSRTLKLECGAIFFKYTKKRDVLLIIICKETFLKPCGSISSGAASTPINSKMNHVVNQLLFKIRSVQKYLYFTPKI